MRGGYANVIATIAVFVALGGTSYATLKLPRTPSRRVPEHQCRDAEQGAHGVDPPQRSRAEPTRHPRLARTIGPAGLAGPTGAGNIVVHTREESAARPDLAAAPTSTSPASRCRRATGS